MKLLTLLCVLLLAVSVSADTTFTIGAGAGPEADMTYINQGATNTNYGTGVTAWVYDSSDAGVSTVILIRWDALADSLNHGGVPLYLKSLKIKWKSNLAALDRPTTGTMFAARCRRGTTSSAKWTETGAKWTEWKSLNSWSTNGARNVTNDVDTTVMVSFDWSTVSFNSDSTVEFDITTVGQTMDAADTAKCHGGFLFFSPWWGSFTDWGALYHQFHTDDAATAAYRPTLTAIYTRAVQPVASSTPPRRRRDDLSMLDKIRIYSFTDKGALQCAGQ